VAKDPYKLLGVKRGADDVEIRKAYRALAKKLHPDVNPNNKAAAERFKEVSAAHTLLSDKKLRKQYDAGGIDASGQQQHPFRHAQTHGGQMGGQGFGDMGDLLSSLFGMQMGGQRTAHPFNQPRPQKGGDIRYTLEIGLPEAVTGVTKQVRMAGGKSLKITIPEGTNDDSILRLRGKGSPGVQGGPAGDAKITIKVKPHKNLRRDGNNLRIDMPITLKEAVLGAKIQIPTPKGKINLKIAPGTSSGKILRLKGKGVKNGDLLVRLMIILPEKPGKALKSSVKALDEQDNPRGAIKF